jgi:hypothetical protein
MTQNKWIIMSRRLFQMHLEVHEAVKGAGHVHHHLHVQGESHVEVQEGHKARQINQHKQEVVLDALRSA